MQNIALYRGYDTGGVHRGLELLGITGYIPAIQFSNSPEKYGFYYLPQEDAFRCPEGAKLVYQRLNCSLLSGGRKTRLPTAELQPNNREILAVLSGARRYLQTLYAKRH